jgi:beta-glucosidase
MRSSRPIFTHKLVLIAAGLALLCFAPIAPALATGARPLPRAGAKLASGAAVGRQSAAAHPTSQLPPALSNSKTPLYLDPGEPIDVRVDDLMRRMTLLEKVGQLNVPCVYVDQLGKTIAAKKQACIRFAAGTYTDEIGPGGGFFTLANTILKDMSARQQAEYFNLLQRTAIERTRLHIPLLEDEEGTHGAMLPGATVFPEGLAIGSTWDMSLVRSIYAAAAEEARSLGIHMLSTLVAEVNRDPRLGRNMEGYTEDPYLYSRIIYNVVRGTQGDDVAANDRVAACLTDFPTQSEPLSGLERGAVQISDRQLREVFLPPWISGITRAGALGVMAGYPEFDDVPAHASEMLLTDMLRHELGFKGVVLSEGDGFGSLLYEGVADSQKQAGAIALKAGVDLDITYEPAYMQPLIENVREGRVSEALVNRALKRLLELKFRLGLFEHPYADPNRAEANVHSAAHRRLALDAAREGIVLLKNDHDLLPLKKDLGAIAVIGPDADSGRNQIGDYAPSQVPQHITTVLDGIRRGVSPQTKVLYARGTPVIGGDHSGFAEAERIARSANVAVVVVGERPRDDRAQATDGEGYDVSSLDLTGAQEDLVEAVAATGTPTVVVLINGRPLSTRWIADHIPAIVEAWEPGEDGGSAVADVLFGNYNPSGRLAITVPRSAGALPAFYDAPPSKQYWIHRGWAKPSYVNEPATPLYSFGDGLSYTTFEYRNLRLDPPQIRPAGAVRITVDVANTGGRPGTETAQLYVHQRVGTVSTPIERLRGFQRVELAPGETKTVSFTLAPQDLALLNQHMDWVVEPGDFDILVGHASDDIRLRGLLHVLQ